MVYFQINPIGFDCRTDKNNCEKYPDFCKECVKAQLERFGLNLDHNVKFTIIDSEEKRIQMFQDLIWQKFLDVLNIKYIFNNFLKIFGRNFPLVKNKKIRFPIYQ